MTEEKKAVLLGAGLVIGGLLVDRTIRSCNMGNVRLFASILVDLRALWNRGKAKIVAPETPAAGLPEDVPFKTYDHPGAAPPAADLDFARTILQAGTAVPISAEETNLYLQEQLLNEGSPIDDPDAWPQLQ